MTLTNDKNEMLLETEFKKVAGKPFEVKDFDETNREKTRSIFPESDEEKHKQMLENAMYYLDQVWSWYGYSAPTLEG